MRSRLPPAALCGHMLFRVMPPATHLCLWTQTPTSIWSMPLTPPCRYPPQIDYLAEVIASSEMWLMVLKPRRGGEDEKNQWGNHSDWLWRGMGVILRGSSIDTLLISLSLQMKGGVAKAARAAELQQTLIKVQGGSDTTHVALAKSACAFVRTCLHGVQNTAKSPMSKNHTNLHFCCSRIGADVSCCSLAKSL